MARDRNAKRILASQLNPNLSPTQELTDGFCRILLADVPMLKQLGQDLESRPRCSQAAECALQQLFQTCQKPLELEIGCGMGKFIAARAKNHPEHHFLGVEYEEVRTAHTDVAIRSNGLTNANVVCGQADRFVEFCIPDGKLVAVHLYFPDPWPKKRHHKNRLFQADFVRHVYRALAPQGTLNVATDHADYFEQMQTVMAENPLFESIPPLERAPDERTEFELKFRAKNQPIYAASWKKR